MKKNQLDITNISLLDIWEQQKRQQEVIAQNWIIKKMFMRKVYFNT